MKKALAQLAFLIFGLVIVAISLFSANVVHSQGENLEFGRRQLYISDQIMPDHLLYPMVAVLDRLKLETSSSEMKPWIKFIYAQRRADYAEELLKKGYRGLAFSTLSKACKYHTEALVSLSEELNSDGNGEEMANGNIGKKMMLNEHSKFVKKVEFLKSSFLDADQQELNRLLIEQIIVLQSF